MGRYTNKGEGSRSFGKIQQDGRQEKFVSSKDDISPASVQPAKVSVNLGYKDWKLFNGISIEAGVEITLPCEENQQSTSETAEEAKRRALRILNDVVDEVEQYVKDKRFG